MLLDKIRNVLHKFTFEGKRSEKQSDNSSSLQKNTIHQRYKDRCALLEIAQTASPSTMRGQFSIILFMIATCKCLNVKTSSTCRPRKFCANQSFV